MPITVGPFWAQVLRMMKALDSQQNTDFVHRALNQTGRLDQ